jgi:hypothetical protein
MERSEIWPVHVSRTAWQRLRSSWQRNFGPQGTYWDEAFREKTLWEDIRPWLLGFGSGALSAPLMWWLRSLGVEGFRDWTVVLVVAFAGAWTLGGLTRLARRRWALRHAHG